MMKHEFERIAGYEVSAEDYNNIIEPMYMATDLSKEDFVKVIDKKRFALKPLKKYIKEMKECASSLKESCTHYTDTETQNRLTDLAIEYMERKYGKDFGYIYTRTAMRFSCSYPIEISIHGKNTYTTIETINLI